MYLDVNVNKSSFVVYIMKYENVNLTVTPAVGSYLNEGGGNKGI